MTTNEYITHVEKQIAFFDEGKKEIEHYLKCNKVIVNGVEEPLFFWLQTALVNELQRVKESLEKWEENYKFAIKKDFDDFKLKELISKVENTTLIKSV